MILIEFTGLPGAGKSTICSELLSQLEERSFSVVSKGKALKQTKKSSVALRIKVLSYLLIVAFDNCKCNEIRRVLATCIMNCKLYRGRNQPYEQSKYLVLDQGFIQDILSILHSKRIKDRSLKYVYKIYDCLCSGFENVYIVDVYVSKEKNIERLRTRNGVASRADRLSDKQLISLLDNQNYNLHSILRAIHNQNTIYINNDDNTSVDVLAKTILSEIAG